MIEPFEYEKTRAEPKIRESKVENDRLDSSAYDHALGKLNHFDKTPQDEHFLRMQRPFTEHFQDEFGRVKGKENNKADFQSEVWGAEGTMNSGYEVTQGDMKSENASSIIHKYLDSSVSFVPDMMETVQSIDNLPAHEPALQPGISFVDSRKYMATRF